MQDGLIDENVKYTEVERTLIGMVKVETLVLGIGSSVSLRWYNMLCKNIPVP